MGHSNIIQPRVFSAKQTHSLIVGQLNLKWSQKLIIRELFNLVCGVFFSLSFFFFLLPSFSTFFSHDQTHTLTQTREVRRFAENVRRRQRAVRFTRFLDYRYYKLIFDSFSLKYDMIRSPW